LHLIDFVKKSWKSDRAEPYSIAAVAYPNSGLTGASV
jgi:hypothetical protein